MIKHFTTLVVALFLTIGGAFCQSNPFVVSGTVTVSDTNDPVPYASVSLVESNLRVMTDNAGKFSLKVPNGNGTLRISFMGFETQEVKIDGRNVVNVSLAPATNSLDEVIVIGYGTMAKRDLTASVGKVEMADMVKAPVASFEQALAGRLAGVQVASTDGQPGEGLNIVVRGNNSLTGSNSPLYVVDGFPMENFNSNSINMAEIESIEVLKDASGTAVYGARGANGVIMITTKKGKLGAPVVSYMGHAGVSDVGGELDVLEPYDFVKLQLEIDPQLAAGIYLTDNDPATPDLTLEDYRNVKGVNWFDKIVNPGGFQNHTIRVSGGSEKTRYSLSTSFLDQEGVVMRSGFDRLQGRFTLDQNINTKFKVGINVNYADSKITGIKPREQTSQAVGSGNSVVQNLFYNLWTFRPVARPDLDLELVDVDPEAETFLFNPLKSAQNEYDVDKNRHITLNGYLEYDLTKELKLRITGGADLSATKSELFNNSNTRSASPSIGVGRTNGVNGGIWQEDLTNLSNENILTYSKRFNKDHRLTAVGVVSLQTRKETGFGYKANRIPNEVLGISGLDEGIVFDKQSKSSNWGLVSYTGRVNYSLFEKYTFTATLRADGSSKFPTDKKFGYFPSGAFAWRLSDEKFMKNIPFISNAKLRTSYGLTGNNRIGDFDYWPRMDQGGYAPFGSSVFPAFSQTSFENPNLTWETTSQFDAGLEVGVLKDRLSFELDYYEKQTYDLLYNARISTSTGYSNARVNFGKTQNKGFELTFKSQNIATRNFNWTSDLNISFNENKLVALTSGETMLFSTMPRSGAGSNPAHISRIGNQLVHFYGFVRDGLYQYSDFNEVPGGYELKSELPRTAGALSTTARQPGDAKYKDLNNDGIVNDADQTIIGNPYPKHIGGFSNNIVFRNFDLNVFFQWSYGNEVLNGNRMFMENINGGILNRNVSVNFLNRWTPENQNTIIPRSGANGISGVISSYNVEDGSFLRLKTISLGYNVKSDLIKGLKSARVYLSAQNLHTWTNYSGPDPEVSVKGFGLTPGYDFSAYPHAQTFIFGLNITL